MNIQTEQSYIVLNPSCVHPHPGQPRKFFSQKSSEELLESIRHNGQVVPITVFKDGDESYCIIDGERRWRAITKLNLPHIQCILQNKPDKGDSLFIQSIISNFHRDSLTILEKAYAVWKLIDHGYKVAYIASQLGMHEYYVRRLINLKRLGEKARNLLDPNLCPKQIPLAVLEVIIRKSLDEQDQVRFIRNIIKGGELPTKEPTQGLHYNKLIDEVTPTKKRSQVDQDRINTRRILANNSPLLRLKRELRKFQSRLSCYDSCDLKDNAGLSDTERNHVLLSIRGIVSTLKYIEDVITDGK